MSSKSYPCHLLVYMYQSLVARCAGKQNEKKSDNLKKNTARQPRSSAQ